MNTNKSRQSFLSTFFTGEGYEEREVNGYWLINQWDGNNKRWVIYVYSPESYRAYDEGRKKYAAKKTERETNYDDFQRKVNDDE